MKLLYRLACRRPDRFLYRWFWGMTSPQAWWRGLLFRSLERSMPPCTGGGCCSYCPHVLLAEARGSAERNGFVPRRAP